MASSAHAVIKVNTTEIDLGLDGKLATGTFTLTNSSDAKSVYKLTAKTWKQGVTQQYTPTKDIYLLPPQVTLAPGATQLIRVIARRAPHPTTEMSYRVSIVQVGTTDLPLPRRNINGRMVRVAFEMLISAFLPPRAPPKEPKLIVSAEPKGLKVRNLGDHKVRVSRVKMYNQDLTLKLELPINFRVTARGEMLVSLPVEDVHSIELLSPSYRDGKRRYVLQ